MEKIINILLIEDNPDDVKFTEIQLNTIFGRSHTLQVSDYFSKGLQLLESSIFDIIILDLTLPDANGLDGLKKLLEHHSKCPILILTGFADESLGIEAVQLGAQDYLIKGKASTHSIKRAINYGIERSRLTNQLAENIKKVEAGKARQEFFAALSHEIRTPLNGIIGFTNVLLKEELTLNQKKYLESIKQSGDILQVLINDILDFLKIESDKINIEIIELKLAELINSVLGSFEIRLKEKELVLNKSYDEQIPFILSGDPVRISQILFNLIGNSIKFTPNGGQINVSIGLQLYDEEKANIEIIVSDTGIGVPPEKLESIFEPFVQSSSDTTRNYGGTGLGLSIVKRLVNMMDGTISVKSKLKEGTTFTIILPLKKTTATEISKKVESTISADEPKRIGKLKVLLAEDSKLNQLLVKIILDGFGFETDIADNGKIVIQLLAENNYDIILMDLQMPEMDGYQTTQYIRSEMKSTKSTIPIIALTANISEIDMDKCKTIGMDDYISKPFNEVDLLNKISGLVKKFKK